VKKNKKETFVRSEESVRKKEERERERKRKRERERERERERSDMAPPDRSPRPSSGLSLSVLGKCFNLLFALSILSVFFMTFTRYFSFNTVAKLFA